MSAQAAGKTSEVEDGVGPQRPPPVRIEPFLCEHHALSFSEILTALSAERGFMEAEMSRLRSEVMRLSAQSGGNSMLWQSVPSKSSLAAESPTEEEVLTPRNVDVHGNLLSDALSRQQEVGLSMWGPGVSDNALLLQALDEVQASNSPRSPTRLGFQPESEGVGGDDAEPSSGAPLLIIDDKSSPRKQKAISPVLSPQSTAQLEPKAATPKHGRQQAAALSAREKILTDGQVSVMNAGFRDEDIDPEDSHLLFTHSGMRSRVRNLLLWPGFDSFIGFIIFLDFGMLGVNVQEKLNPSLSDETMLTVQTLDLLCKFIYLVECCLRLYGFGCRWCFKNTFFRLDVFLVACSVVDILLDYVPVIRTGDTLQQVSAMRIIRVARVARIARVTIRLRTLWLLVSGLVHSASTMLWTIILIGAITYIFAILGMELIAPRYGARIDTEYEEIGKKNFGNLVAAMMTLTQVLTMDSSASIYRPLIESGQMPVTCAIYFFTYIFLVSIALMNLVTAVMVEGSLTQASKDKEFLREHQLNKKRKMFPELRQMFQILDMDNSGEVSLSELLAAPDEVRSKIIDITGAENPVHIFQLLDTDDSGTLHIDEFLDGLLKASQGSAIQDFQLSRLVRQITQIKYVTVDGTDQEEALRTTCEGNRNSWQEKDE
eukprot:TRINITY_DN36385_c0_g1_i1.p1 TRINITY_DN36385_c0_g1~~TRINITY_DN36385_c0_g1_i1.p1  ORF type:complete len:657 (+),score=147.93 TRINITY_DN36385_c0_g1_i1:97-2067(+)